MPDDPVCPAMAFTWHSSCVPLRRRGTCACGNVRRLTSFCCCGGGVSRAGDHYVPASGCAPTVGPGAYSGPSLASALVKRSFNVTFGGGVGGGPAHVFQ
jgi:hypothetical protein